MCRQPWIVLGLLIVLFLVLPSGADVVGGRSDRRKRDLPNWSLTSSDFFGWVDELHRYGGYEHIEQLTRTFWAHFPSAERLGYMQRGLDSDESK